MNDNTSMSRQVVKNKILVCVIGTIRGGEVAWNSLIKHVLNHLSADLALFTSKTNDTSILHQTAKFDWSFDDPGDWGDEMNRVCNECGVQENSWHSYARRTSYESLWGGIILDGKVLKGSGALIMLLRDMLLKKLHILKQYEKIIITRSDHLYYFDHPPVTNSDIDIPVGEDYWGVTDRHHVVDATKIETYLCIVKWWMQNLDYVENSILKHHNPEQLLALYFKIIGFSVNRTIRCMASVSLKNDFTRWKTAIVKVPGHDDLFFKYPHEYYSHMHQNKKKSKKYFVGRVKLTNNFCNQH
jgi:hypothetical protein